MKIHIFTDGSGASDTIGTWGAVVVTPVTKQALYGVCIPSTIARMELTPIVEALRWVRKNILKLAVGSAEIVIVSDNESTIQMITGESEIHANRELWAAYNKVSEGMNITAVWRQRNTTPYMEMCDSLAFTLRNEMKVLKERIDRVGFPTIDPAASINTSGDTLDDVFDTITINARGDSE